VTTKWVISVPVNSTLTPLVNLDAHVASSARRRYPTCIDRPVEGSGVVRKNSRTKQGVREQEMTPQSELMCWNRGNAEQGISAGGERES
jgi:hypothetical protein